MKKILALILLTSCSFLLSSFRAEAPTYEYFFKAEKIPTAVVQQIAGRIQFVQSVIDRQDNMPHGVVRELKAHLDTALMLYSQSLKYDSVIIKK